MALKSTGLNVLLKYWEEIKFFCRSSRIILTIQATLNKYVCDFFYMHEVFSSY